MLDQHTAALKETMVQQMQEMGYDLFTVQDLLEERGICENSFDLCTQLI